MRFLSGRVPTLTHTFLDDETALTLSAVVVTVEPAPQGSFNPIATDLAATNDGEGNWSVTLPSLLETGEYVATWTGDNGAAEDETYFDVVPRFTFTVPEVRKIDKELVDPSLFPPDEIRHYREVAEDEFRRITGRSSMVRGRTVVVQSDGSAELVLPDFDIQRITSVTDQDAVVIDTTGWRLRVGKVAVSDVGLVEDAWFTVSYEYGLAPTPEDLRQAMMLRTRILLFDEGKGVPDRATSFTPAGGGTFSLAQAGSRGWQTGIPDVDAVYKRYSLDAFLGAYGAV